MVPRRATGTPGYTSIAPAFSQLAASAPPMNGDQTLQVLRSHVFQAITLNIPGARNGTPPLLLACIPAPAHPPCPLPHSGTLSAPNLPVLTLLAPAPQPNTPNPPSSRPPYRPPAQQLQHCPRPRSPDLHVPALQRGHHRRHPGVIRVHALQGGQQGAQEGGVGCQA